MAKTFPARIKELRDEFRANSELNRMRLLSVHKDQKDIQKTMAKQQKQTLQKLEKLQKEASTQYPEVEEQCAQDPEEDTSEEAPELLLRLEARFPDVPKEVLELCISVHEMLTKEHGTDDYPVDSALDNLMDLYSNVPHDEPQTEPYPEEQGFTFTDS